VTDELKRVLAEPSIEVEQLLGWTAQASPRDTPLFSAIERLARARHPEAQVTANVIGGFTDCNAFRAQNIVCYGFHPMRVKLDELHAIHGKDERADATALAESVLGLHELMRELWAGPPPAGLRGVRFSPSNPTASGAP
jgi:acetylornithine deacetylase/succinyl-diaminopimelate desuccinylase-like protein